ncbi:transcriptional regulator [Campylobacter jejuni]|uniref:transcriptional regulator n=1 Tax=Campylobacter jejuni TaxID=197 RepID=UPI003B9D4EFA
MAKNDDNLIKKTCKDLGLTYKQLGEKIGYSESAIKNAAVGETSEPMKFAINLYLENLALKEQLKTSEAFKQHLKDFLN